MPLHYRQGDVLLLRVDKQIPEQAELVKPDNRDRVVLAYGEVTGHAHALSTKYATMYQWAGDRLLEVKPGAELVHEEHATIVPEPGVYKVVQQREYFPEAIRDVRD